MRSARSRLFLIFLLVTGIFVGSQARAVAEETTSSQLEEIKTRLAALDQQQKQILANQDKIFERLDQLRIWVHRK